MTSTLHSAACINRESQLTLLQQDQCARSDLLTKKTPRSRQNDTNQMQAAAVALNLAVAGLLNLRLQQLEIELPWLECLDA